MSFFPIDRFVFILFIANMDWRRAIFSTSCLITNSLFYRCFTVYSRGQLVISTFIGHVVLKSVILISPVEA